MALRGLSFQREKRAMTSSCPHDRSLPTRKHSPAFFKCMDSSFNPFTAWSVRSGYLIKRLQCWSVQLQDVCLPFFLCLNQTVDKHIYSCFGVNTLRGQKALWENPIHSRGQEPVLSWWVGFEEINSIHRSSAEGCWPPFAGSPVTLAFHKVTLYTMFPHVTPFTIHWKKSSKIYSPLGCR